MQERFAICITLVQGRAWVLLKRFTCVPGNADSNSKKRQIQCSDEETSHQVVRRSRRCLHNICLIMPLYRGQHTSAHDWQLKSGKREWILGKRENGWGNFIQGMQVRLSNTKVCRLRARLLKGTWCRKQGISKRAWVTSHADGKSLFEEEKNFSLESFFLIDL